MLPWLSSVLSGRASRPASFRLDPRVGAVICGVLATLLTTSTFAMSLRAIHTPADEATARDLRLGKGLYDQGMFERAIPPLERVRGGNASRDERAESLFLLGESYRSLDRWKEAEERFGELLRRAPRSEWVPLAQLGRGEALVRLDRAAEATSVLEPATRGPEEHRATALYWLAEAWARSNELPRAITAWQKLLTEHAEDDLAPFAAYNAALRLRENGDPASGLNLLDSFRSNSIDAAMRDRLSLLTGELALAAEKPRRAVRAFEAVRGDDDRPAALAGLAWAASALDDRSKLIEVRRTLAREYPDAPERLEVDLLAGSAAAEAGDSSNARSILTPLLNSSRGDEAQFWLAWSYRAANEPARAAEMFLSIDGDGDWARRGVLRGEEESRKAEKWEQSLEAARRYVAEWRDDPQASAVVAGAVESSYRLGDDTRVMELEQSFLSFWKDDPLAGDVRHYAAEAAIRAGDPAAAIERFQVLWRSDESRRPRVAARYAWAIWEARGASGARAISRLLPALDGAVAAEVGVLLGRAYVAGEETDKALAAFRAASAADPRGEAGGRARLEEALLLGRGDRSDPASLARAEQAARAVLAGNAEASVRARARLELAGILAQKGEDRGAISEYEASLEEATGDADRIDAYLGLAFCAWRVGDFDKAKSALSRLGRENPDDATRAEALFIAGRVAQDAKQGSRAMRSLEESLSLAPNGPRAPEILRELARIAEENEDTAQALEYLKERVEKHPQATGADEALYRWAWLSLSRDNAEGTAQARTGFTRLLRDHPKTSFAADAEFRLGEIAYATEDFATAERHFRRSIERDADARIAERARYRLGWSSRKAERWKEAATTFLQLADEHPDGDLAGESLYLAADSADRAGDGEQMETLLTRFLKDHNEHERAASAKVRLGEVLGEKEEWRAVRDLLNPLRTVELDEPWRTRSRITLGRALVRLGSGRQAIPILTEALDEGGARAAEAQFEIGLAHRAAGDRDRAIEAFIHGPVLYPFKPWAVKSSLEAGRDLLATGKRKEAKRLLERAIEQDPDGPIGREAKRILRGSDDKESF